MRLYWFKHRVRSNFLWSSYVDYNYEDSGEREVVSFTFLEKCGIMRYGVCDDSIFYC